MREKPPSIILKLRKIIENGTDEEARVAQIQLTDLLAKGGRNAAAKRRENNARKAATQEARLDAETEEFLKGLLDANAHLAPRGTYPADVEALLEPYRED